jgi:hypothetical protein
MSYYTGTGSLAGKVWPQNGLHFLLRFVARELIEDDRKVDKFRPQPNVSDVRDPQLIDAGQLHPSWYVQAPSPARRYKKPE